MGVCRARKKGDGEVGGGCPREQKRTKKERGGNCRICRLEMNYLNREVKSCYIFRLN